MRQLLQPVGVLLASAIIIAVGSVCAPAPAIADLLTNGDFTAGSDNSPTGWHARVSLPSTEYTWTAPSDSNPGQIEIDNHLRSDARLMHPVYLPPGWYYISAESRTDGVSRHGTGAFIGLTDEGVGSPQGLGDTDWERLAFYLEVGKSGADVEIALRLGDYWDFSPGRAWFRSVSIAAVDGPPEGFPSVFHLDKVRLSQAGSLASLAAAFAILIAFACVGWYLCVPSGDEVDREMPQV